MGPRTGLYRSEQISRGAELGLAGWRGAYRAGLKARKGLEPCWADHASSGHRRDLPSRSLTGIKGYSALGGQLPYNDLVQRTRLLANTS